MPRNGHWTAGSAAVEAREKDLVQEQPDRGGHRNRDQRADDTKDGAAEEDGDEGGVAGTSVDRPTMRGTSR
jgi:hypothetical protein